MTIEQLRKDMMAAAKARDKERKEVLSALVGAVMKLAIDEGKRDNIPEELVDRAIVKEQRAAKESIDTCPDSRPELKEQYTYRYNVISEIRQYLTQNCAEVLATKNKGQIMKTVMPLLKGKADGKDISKVVAELTK